MRFVRRDVKLESQVVGYSAGNFGKNLLLGGLDVTLLYMLTDLLKLKPGAVGLLMTIVFAGDFVFDIAAGFVATWSRERGFGYRKLIVAGVIPCGAAFALLYAVPLAGLHSLPVLALVLLVFRGAYAIIDVPHNSLLARVAPDSRSRGRTSGYRLFFSSLASLATAVLLAPAVIAAARQGHMRQLALLGTVGAVAACLSLWLAAWSSMRDRAERPGTVSRKRIALLPKADWLLAGLIGIGILTGFAMPMFSRMAMYLCTYVYHRPDLAARLLLAMTIGQFPGVIIWTYLVRYTDKVKLLAISHALSAVAMLVFALARPDPRLLIGLSALIGGGLAGVYMFPWGILVDVIDFAEFRHGERREAAAVAVILVTAKASAAAAAGAIGWAFDRLGYVAGVAQTPAVLLGFKLLALGVPVAGSVIAILILSRMAVGDRAHARILRALAARRTRIDQGSSGSRGSTLRDEAEGRKTSSVGESRRPTAPG